MSKVKFAESMDNMIFWNEMQNVVVIIVTIFMIVLFSWVAHLPTKKDDNKKYSKKDEV